MKKRNIHDAALNRILNSQGFFKSKNVFIRYHGDGVIQSVWYNHEPRLLVGDGYNLCFSIGSVYEKDLFGPFNDQPEMTGWHSVAEYYTRCHRISRQDAWKMNEQAQLEVFMTHVLPELNSLNTQERLYKFSCQLELLEHGQILYHLASDLFLTLRLSIYDESHRYVNERIEYLKSSKEHVRDQMIHQQCSTIDINARMRRFDQKLLPLVEIKEWLNLKAFDRIEALLQEERDKNLHIYLNLLPPSVKEEETQRLLPF